jgi:hypothetical protein
MANITEEHLHHMARRHHATMQKLDTIKASIAGYAQKSFGLMETGFGAWAGGVLEGRTGGMAVGPLPLNLLLGAGFLVAGFASTNSPALEKYSEHFNNLGNGFVGSYLAATGYAFGKRWKETGKVLGGGGHPWTQPYENGWPKGVAAPPVKGDYYDAYVGQGDLGDQEMAAIVQRMQAAANAPAQP